MHNLILSLAFLRFSPGSLHWVDSKADRMLSRDSSDSKVLVVRHCVQFLNAGIHVLTDSDLWRCVDKHTDRGLLAHCMFQTSNASGTCSFPYHSFCFPSSCRVYSLIVPALNFAAELNIHLGAATRFPHCIFDYTTLLVLHNFDGALRKPIIPF